MIARATRILLLGCLTAISLGTGLTTALASPLVAPANRPPDIPSEVGPGRGWYGGDTSPYRLVTTTPSFVARVDDSDRGQQVAGHFRITRHHKTVWAGTSGFDSGDHQVVDYVPEGRLAEGVRYRLTVRGLDDDGARSAGRSAPIRFLVDLTNPGTEPLVHAVRGAPAVYEEGVWAGGVGVLGKFTFRNGGDDTVVRYSYGFNLSGVLDESVAAGPHHDGRSARVDFIPQNAGLTFLSVAGYDAAGRRGPLRTYDIYVNYPARTGWWDVREGSGAVAQDLSGGGHPLSVSPTTEWTDGIVNAALHFDEPTDHALSDRGVVATQHAFTVTARVRLDSLAATGVAVSQDGDHRSGFNLGYVSGGVGCPGRGNGCFQLWAPDSDAAGEPTYARAGSAQDVHPGEWYFLLGSYNWGAPAGQQLQLFTCNADRFEWQSGMAGRDAGWRADGPLRVGQSEVEDAAADPWLGDIDTVTVYDGAVAFDSYLDLCLGTP